MYIDCHVAIVSSTYTSLRGAAGDVAIHVLKNTQKSSDNNNVKKLIFSVFFIFTSFFSFAQTIPARLLGIWEGKDRYVFFEENENEEPQIVIVLKTYYGWYLNRAAEPASYAEKEERVRNTANARKAEHIYIQNIDTKETSNSLYGSLDLAFSRWQKNTIPFLLLDDSIYLNYFVLDEKDQSTSPYKFYRGIAPSKGFVVSTNSEPENITGYIIDGDKLYDVRYWFTDMDYSSDYITFNYKDDTYSIPKHLKSCGRVYSCVSGRSKKVRNPVRPFEYKVENYLFNDQKNVFTENKEAYLKKLADKDTFEELIKIIKESNSRRKPDPPALFPESNLDWHWDLIDQLESGNLIIQEVRKRQKAFGPRGRDRGK